MEKKYFEAPYLKVVNVNTDIITGSIGGGEQMGHGGNYAPYRNIFSEELLDSEDFEEEY